MSAKPPPPKPIGPIETAWRTYMRDVVPVTAGVEQLRATRAAFFGGATALYTSIMAGLDAGDEATQGDLEMMAAIARELAAFEP